MTDLQTSHGTIHYGGTCRDDYPNIELYDQPPAGGSPVRLQAPAMRAFKAAERAYGSRSRKRRWRRDGRPIPITGSWRACSYQRALWESDPDRFANPDGSMHPRGLAVDVRNDLGPWAKRAIGRALYAQGWRRVRPDDEPWHWSFGVTA